MIKHAKEVQGDNYAGDEYYLQGKCWRERFNDGDSPAETVDSDRSTGMPNSMTPKPSAEGTSFVDEVRRIVQETGCDEASAKARILREAVEGAVEITADWKVKPLAEGTGHCGNREHGGRHAERNDCYGFDPVPSEETRGTDWRKDVLDMELVIEILKNCSADYCYPESRNPENPQYRIDLAIANGVKILQSWKPLAPEAVGTKEPTSWRTEMLGDDVGRETRDELAQAIIRELNADVGVLRGDCIRLNSELSTLKRERDQHSPEVVRKLNEEVAEFRADCIRLASQVRELTAQRDKGEVSSSYWQGHCENADKLTIERLKVALIDS